jgi:hypothetical protein
MPCMERAHGRDQHRTGLQVAEVRDGSCNDHP